MNNLYLTIYQFLSFITVKLRSAVLIAIIGFSFSGSIFKVNANPLYDKVEKKVNNSFPVRGFHIDLRIQVMTMSALRNFAKELSDFGINTLVMEWEASYPYEKHATISNKYSYTREEVKAFINYCDSLSIDVIPLQQCFGHVEYILRHSRYSSLSEANKEISQVCPLKTKGDSLLFSDLFADMASLHTSKYIHIGGDETYLLGNCAECSKKAAIEGKSKLFVDYMKMICGLAVKLGKTPIMWADILLQYPEAATELPKETVFIEWNYGWEINRFGDIEKLLDKGFNFWGAPAIRSHPDNWYTTDWQKHFNNQRDFIPYARKAGYNGMIMTSWSTSGIYGFNWDTNYEVIDMHAIRNVYPISGFRILIAAYAQALKQADPLDPEAFVLQYAQDRFGLTANEGGDLWKILSVSPQTVNLDSPTSIAELDSIIQRVSQAKEIMASLKPKDHQKEFEHLRLMLDLKDYYLKFKRVESIYESDQFTMKNRTEILPELQRLLDDSKDLDERFANLNKGFMYPDEIKEQNLIRNKKLENIYLIIADESEEADSQ